jgi:hypothetical protein
VSKRAQTIFGGTPRFFRISLRDENLRNYFLTNFSLMQYHHYSLNDIESMMPWERMTYVALVSKHVKEENERIRQQNEKIEVENKKRRRRK